MRITFKMNILIISSNRNQMNILIISFNHNQMFDKTKISTFFNESGDSTFLRLINRVRKEP